MNLIDQEQAQQLETEWRTRAAHDFMTFVDGLTIDGQRGPAMFQGVMAPFQRTAFAAVAPALESLRRGAMPLKKRHWWERTKKAGKDSDLAACLLWLVAFPMRPFYIQVGAADKDQARIVKDRLTSLLFHNEWLNDYVSIKQWQVTSKMLGPDGTALCRIDIMAADIAGAHGGTPDLLVINELSHIVKWEFVENLMDNADGVAQGVVMIATNAGHKGTKAETWRQNAEKNNWEFHVWDSPAPWHDEEAIEDARRRHTRSRFARLWRGKWVSGKGDALNEQDIDKCFPPGIMPQPTPVNGWLYLGALDLGISHDHSGGLILGVHLGLQRCRVAQYKGWEPSKKTGEVDLAAVEEWMHLRSRTFNCQWIGYDPYQAVYMAQRLRLRGVPMRPVQWSAPKVLMGMANALISTIETGKLECFEDPDGRLRRDLGKMSIIEKPYGYRLEATKDETGHADVGAALCMALMRAVEIMTGHVGLQDDDDLFIEDHQLDAEEVAIMPDELRDIFEMESDTRVKPKTLLRDSWEGW